MQDTVIVGEQNAGEAAQARAELAEAIGQLHIDTFGVARLLLKVQRGRFYTEPTWQEFIKTLDLKPRKAEYLVKMADTMDVVGIPKEEYEPVGLTKLREITRLDPTKTYTNPVTNETTPMGDWIKGLVEIAPTKTLEEVQQSVRTLMGEVGENDKVWHNFYLLRTVDENAVKPALDKAKANIGQVGQDKDGAAIEPTDSAALEVVCVTYKLSENEQ
jgi:hypothetical protein